MFYKAIQPDFYFKNGIIANGSRKAKRIHADVFLEMPIILPCMEEQNRIVDMLSSFDNLITLHQRECKFYSFNSIRIKISLPNLCLCFQVLV